MTAVPTRRERQRQATFDEIVEVSRRLLREGEDVSIRAVAQEMGLTPPALYRYVDSHADLLDPRGPLDLRGRGRGDDGGAGRPGRRTTRRPRSSRRRRRSARGRCATAPSSRWSSRRASRSQLDEAAQAPRRSRRKLITSLADCLPDDSGVHLFAAFFSEIFGRLWVKYQFAIPTDDELDPELLEILRSEIKPDEVTDGLGLAHARAWCGCSSAPGRGSTAR